MRVIVEKNKVGGSTEETVFSVDPRWLMAFVCFLREQLLEDFEKDRCPAFYKFHVPESGMKGFVNTKGAMLFNENKAVSRGGVVWGFIKNTETGEWESFLFFTKSEVGKEEPALVLVQAVEKMLGTGPLSAVSLSEKLQLVGFECI